MSFGIIWCNYSQCLYNWCVVTAISGGLVKHAALFCCSSHRPVLARTFGRDWGPWSEASSSPWLIPAVSCGKIWTLLHQLQLQLEYFLHTFHSFFTMFHAFQVVSGFEIRPVWSCLSQQTFVHIFWIFLVPKPGETTLLQDELQETKERSKELQATVMAVAMPEPCEESPRHQDTRDTRTKHSRNYQESQKRVGRHGGTGSRSRWSNSNHSR